MPSARIDAAAVDGAYECLALDVELDRAGDRGGGVHLDVCCPCTGTRLVDASAQQTGTIRCDNTSRSLLVILWLDGFFARPSPAATSAGGAPAGGARLSVSGFCV